MKKENVAVPKIDEKLGMHFCCKNNSFYCAFWAPSAINLTCNVYTDAHAKKSAWQFELVPCQQDGVWRYEGILPDELVKNAKACAKQNPFCKNFACAYDLFYDFTLVCKNKDGTKTCKTVFDPYGFSFAPHLSDAKQVRAAFIDFDNERAQSNVLCAQNAKSGAQKSANNKQTQKFLRQDVIIYEISVRDFTISQDASTISVGGTFDAFAEKLDYLVDLGVTHVQLLPVLNFINIDETNIAYQDEKKLCNANYNWGYDPYNYFALSGFFGCNAHDPYERIRALRALVDCAHAKGLRVILDVVYNHQGSAHFLEQIESGYFFRTQKDASFTNNSGCGNDLATERAFVQKLIVDSVAHLVKVYQIDGLRFDLMGLIDVETIQKAYARANAERDVLFIGEGWKMYNGKKGTRGMDQNFMCETENVAVFNDELRDLVKAGGFTEQKKAFITGGDVDTKALFYNLTGRPFERYRVINPCNNVQYLACHDGLTLHDNIALNCGFAKVDGVANFGVAQIDNLANFDATLQEHQLKELYRRIKLGNFLVLTAQGIAFLHGGQEYGRTKPSFNLANEAIGQFVKNSYRSADCTNAFLWTRTNVQKDLYAYTKSLINFRRKTRMFRLGSLDAVQNQVFYCPLQCSCGVLVYRIYIEDNGAIDKADGICNWYVMINAMQKSVRLNMALCNAQIFADMTGANLLPVNNSCDVKINAQDVEIAPLSACIIRAQN